MPHPADRPYDLVLFGATGFTGGLTADYLAAHLPDGARWAIAGRNQGKLEQVRERLAASDRPPRDLALQIADAGDPASLQAVAESARVVITTVGPYLEHGEPLVAACATAGTDYVDLTGEPEFIDRMYLAHNATAAGTGARLVHACGFDSIPHDLGVLFTVQHLPSQVPLAIRGIVRSSAMFSGGTFQSALGQMARGRQMRQAAAERKQIEPRPAGRRVRARASAPHKDDELDLWLVPLPTVDPVIVKHTAAARADYGPDFTYAHYAGVKRLTTVVVATTGVAAFAGAAQIPPLRSLIASRIRAGDGPSQERRDRSWFTVDFLGEGGGQRVHTQVRGGDPGYTETSKMLAESAMCLAFDDNPELAGQLTTATAMGEHLTRRLVAAGITFSLV
ncbi:MAG: saccharopine dehydrogenase family protein [Candidatus Nanopelagicales bacterium]